MLGEVFSIEFRWRGSQKVGGSMCGYSEVSPFKILLRQGRVKKSCGEGQTRRTPAPETHSVSKAGCWSVFGQVLSCSS